MRRTLGNSRLIESLPELAYQLRVNFGGAYYLGSARASVGMATAVLAWPWCGVLALVGLVEWRRWRSRRATGASLLLCLAVFASIAAPWLMFEADARYLLPVSAPLVVLAGLHVADLARRSPVARRLAAALTAIVLALGAGSMVEFRRYNYLWSNPPGAASEAERLRRVIDALRAKGVSAVFSMNGLLDSQIVFYSGERIRARWMPERTRYPEYVRYVNRALARGRPVAVVGYTHDSGAPGCWDGTICTGGLETLVPDPDAIVHVDGKYFVYVGADKGLLRRLGFEFQE